MDDKNDIKGENEAELSEDIEEGNEDTDWKAEATKYHRIAKQRGKKLGESDETIKGLQEKLEEPKEPKPQDKKEEKSDDKLLERLEKISLKTEGIKEADEIELFNKWKDQTGREADDIVGNEIFKKELEDLRTTKKNLEATSDIKGEGEKGSVKDNPDYWIGKGTKGDDGKLRLPDETPKELYSKILDKLSEGEPGSSEKLRFYNE